jgi:hypothetical protein
MGFATGTSTATKTVVFASLLPHVMSSTYVADETDSGPYMPVYADHSWWNRDRSTFKRRGVGYTRKSGSKRK